MIIARGRQFGSKYDASLGNTGGSSYQNNSNFLRRRRLLLALFQRRQAYVLLKAGQSVSADELKAHARQQLAPYKYPRWIEFVGKLPKPATGKIQRFKLRQSSHADAA